MHIRTSGFVLGLLLLIAQAPSLAQPLKKRGQLGVAAVALTDSLAHVAGIANRQGVWVRQLVSRSTAERIGVQPGDVISEINGQTIASPADLIRFAQRVSEGDPLRVTLVRAGRPQTLTGVAQARPVPTAVDLELVYDEFTFRTGSSAATGQVRALVKRPKGSAGRRLPVLYFIQGTACLSMAYLPEGDPYKVATDELARRGFAVFMVEKSGMGDNAHTPPCESVGFDEELALFKQGYNRLLTYDSVDTSRVFLFGHSLGGITAPLLAQTYRPRGIVVFGGVVRTWHDFIVDVLRDQKILEGADPGRAEADLQALRPFLYGYFYQKQSPWALLQANPAHEPLVRRLLDYEQDTLIFGRHYRFWQELNDHNLYAAWQRTSAPVLALYGEADVNALKPDDHVQIASIVNRQHPGWGTYRLVPRTNHSMQVVGTMTEFLQNRLKQPNATHPFNTTLMDEVAGWIHEQMGSAAATSVR